jgi:FkbM family methyltransferase
LISSFVYRRVLYGNRVTKTLWNMARRLMIKIDGETLCTMKVHGRDLVMPLSHAMPLYLQQCPFYDRLPGRLAKFTNTKLNSVKCIDVGANIGDSIAAFKEPLVTEEKRSNADIFLAVEPNPKFRRCLDLNWGNDQSVIILPYICSSSEGNTTACINELNGTASIDFSANVVMANGKEFERKTIDSIVSQYKQHGDFNLLKIDTDGHDFEVLSGARGFIMKSQPFLYFEVDAFSNPKFVEDCLSTLEFLHEVGYGKIFIYDNFGNFMGVFEISDISCIKRLLFYKLTKEYYFDFLLMKDCFVDEFYKQEVEYFVNAIKDTRLCQAV